ncbi:hypothetical protein [Aureimonas leprariae]|uniref:Uncharacterized protein n=1 Tax=Plantimonas leprariae TaxID=2615207 RepID=A0A7V7PQ73_9HYPH|nr:hypothetical protein [Aureimonas leprariae]KAB0680303.1 hypothetical protein F6X38_08990 [Aureimonas leprariae]
MEAKASQPRSSFRISPKRRFRSMHYVSAPMSGSAALSSTANNKIFGVVSETLPAKVAAQFHSGLWNPDSAD